MAQLEPCSRPPPPPSQKKCALFGDLAIRNDGRRAEARGLDGGISIKHAKEGADRGQIYKHSQQPRFRRAGRTGRISLRYLCAGTGLRKEAAPRMREQATRDTERDSGRTMVT